MKKCGNFLIALVQLMESISLCSVQEIVDQHTLTIRDLLALVDADYKLTYVDIGCQGPISDGGIFKNC